MSADVVSLAAVRAARDGHPSIVVPPSPTLLQWQRRKDAACVGLPSHQDDAS